MKSGSRIISGSVHEHETSHYLNRGCTDNGSDHGKQNSYTKWNRKLKIIVLTDIVHETSETRTFALAAPDSVSSPALRRSRLCADKILKTNKHFLEIQVNY